ncbi:GtrA family protein [Aquibium sp. A9E412]|uniref:GtrA family protein n=1 Tax=Aquibium sp. A9E412 TaxID=2976767 RepID=UPI0025B0E8A8|nr:GtrA family protein [Aquibium sp. A9E412]MDN2565314.1 GtrA family protein [Aquibium sp. A9E412]
MRRFAGFGIVGGFGFLVDAGTLLALSGLLSVDPLAARVVSIACALTVTWLLNRHFNFGASSRPVAVEGARYGGIGAGTSVVNYAVYSLILLAAPWVSPILALAVASGLAMLVSFAGYTRFVFDR